MATRATIAGRLPKDANKAYLATYSLENPSEQGSWGYSDFFIGDVPTNIGQKVQIRSGSSNKLHILNFGTRPSVVNISGYLVAYQGDGDWVRKFVDLFIPGAPFSMTALTKRKRFLRLFYSDRWVDGYVLSTSIVENSAQDPLVGFNMEWIILNAHLGG